MTGSIMISPESGQMNSFEMTADSAALCRAGAEEEEEEEEDDDDGEAAESTAAHDDDNI